MNDQKRDSTSIIKKPFRFLSTWRSLPPYELISYILMYASVPMLVYGIKIYNWEIFKVIILTIIALYSGYFATLIWNDITDADIDALAHPDRPIPGGRISSKRFFIVALFFSATTFIFSYLVNIWCLALVGAAALFVAIHNKYLKKIIKIPAYSEIFTPIQWVVVAVFGFFAIWTTLPQSNEITISMPIFGDVISTSFSEIQTMILLVIFTYFTDVAHDLPEGIHDLKGDLKSGVKTYATTFGEVKTIKISFAMYIISGILGILLYIKTILSPIFLILFLILWIYMMSFSFRLLVASKEKRIEFSSIVGRKGFDYFIFVFNLIFLDILIQLVLNYYNISI
jgi:4-hydroxybenzoate polyprenyltransferase